MVNMSYCRFRNTASDLAECIDALDCDGIESLSDSEQVSASYMAELCEEYLVAYESAAGETK